MEETTEQKATPQAVVPTYILDAFIPGYSALHNVILHVLGTDINYLVSSAAILWLFSKVLYSPWETLMDLVEEYFMSSLTIEENNRDLCKIQLAYFAKREAELRIRSINAALNHDPEERTDEEMVSEMGWLNFAFSDANTPMRYTPSTGTYRTKINGRTHYLYYNNPVGSDLGFMPPASLKIACYGRSTQSIKLLIREMRFLLPGSCKEKPHDSISTEHFNTVGYRYSARGIPYRRGYLLYGPPGTGKSSLAYAVAGLFGLEILFLSLMDKNLDEEKLSDLFAALPEKCLVLLEDIDSAGLNRDMDESEDEDSESEDEDDSKSAKKKASKENKNTSKNKGISLSGLLNTIDGVASNEGRVLFMTTNCPEKLDSAFIRPGRIDLQVEFTNATQFHAKEIFERMYARQPIRTNASVSTPEAIIDEKETTSEDRIYGEEIKAMALEFADHIPDGLLSPAEIQGFLLNRRKEPKKALEEVTTWVKGLLESKKKGKKVVGAQ